MNAPLTRQSASADGGHDTARRPAPVLTWVRRPQPALPATPRTGADDDGPPPEEPGYGHGV